MSTATQSRKSSLEPLFREASVGSSRAIAALAVSLEPRVRVRVTPLWENLDRQLAGSQVGAIIAGVLGALALTLASVGVFGVFAYVVQQRTHEIGIRMALGARSFFIGLGIGLVGAVAGSRLIQSFLFGLSLFDLPAYAAIALILAAAGIAASYIPARRASRIDPVSALRCE